MTSTSVPGQRKANFWRDLHDPRTRYAEQLVYDYLRGVKRWPVTDTRKLHVPWDFEVHPHPGITWRLDVKADRWMDESDRLPYETEHVYPDGSTKLGWGRIAELDVVAVVAMGKKGVRGSHRCVLVQRPAMHQLVESAITKAERERCSMPANWVPFKPDNECGDYITHGWAVPMDQAFKAMVYRETWELPGGRS